MPEALDPAWEYWTPDPEIAEVMGIPVPSGFDGILTFSEDSRGQNRPSGMRFGRGDPDSGKFFLAPDRTASHPSRPCDHCREFFEPARSNSRYCSPSCRGLDRLASPRPCATCGTTFEPRFGRARYCSRHCVPRADQRVLPDIPCGGCGVMFRPLSYRAKYCSRTCVPWGSWVRSADRPCRECGEPCRRGKTFCSSHCFATNRWRLTLNLSPRPRTGGSRSGRRLQPWSGCDEEYVVWLRRQKAPIDLCAARLGRPAAAVVGKLNRLGVTVESHRDPVSARRAVKRLHGAGFSDAEIASKLSRSKRDVRYLRGQLNLPANPWKCPRKQLMPTTPEHTQYHVGARVVIVAPHEPAVDGLAAVVEKLDVWGAYLIVERERREYDAPDHQPRWRALWAEMRPAARDSITAARASGYTGNACPHCSGVRMVRVGACERCEDCGDSTSCA